MRTMTTTASTANHLWYLEDVLGQGATASVYKARNKKSGELVAVKVFNMASYNRPSEVQMREFEMLRRLNHVNIVRLFAVEELNTNSQQQVLVMEFCSGGSLLNLLEEPENLFGLPESEFLTVLQCVVNGMNHLRDHAVVHRDIKPGNIMRQVGEDGRSIYKLIDFGAARLLEDDEKFMSIYGTEEYLHPDMYERAILKKPRQRCFGVTVDLWSIGVTFYHAATGNLPFIPYGGPRKNKHIMYKITNQKPEGSIAGCQPVEDGPIEWTYQLPLYCQLSEGLKSQLVPVLANVLESNQEKCWGFDQFFAATTDILHRIKVHVYSVQQATAHCIYVHFYNTASVFFEEVQAQTNIVTEVQQYHFQGHPLLLEPSMKVINLPRTTEERPIFLLSRQHEKIIGLPTKEPEAQVMPTRFDIVADHAFSKTMVAIAHQYLRMVSRHHKHRGLILQGFYGYIENLRVECNNAAHKVAMVNMKLLSCLSTEKTLQALRGQLPLDLPDDNMKKLCQIQDTMPMYGGSIREFQNSLHHLQVGLAKHSETLDEDRSIQKMEVLLEKIVAVYRQYRKDKLFGKLTYNDEQIHKFEKINLSSSIKKMKALFRDDCLQKYHDVLSSVQTWNSTLHDMQTKLEGFSRSFLQLIRDLQMCERHQTTVMDKVLELALQRPEALDTPKNKDHLILRMRRLRDEMNLVARELQNNNSIIESLGAFNSTVVVVEPSVPQPKGGR